MPDSAQTEPRRPGRLRRRLAIFLGISVLSLVASQIAGQCFYNAKLVLRCQRPHRVRMTGSEGSFAIPRSAAYPLLPGPAWVEVWNRDRGCWSRRELSIEARARAVVDLEELAAHGPCGDRTPPPF